jgi:hypothetical protein
MKTVLNAMLPWPPILLGAFVLFSDLFSYPQPEGQVRTNRGRYLGSLLTVCRNSHAAVEIRLTHYRSSL